MKELDKINQYGNCDVVFYKKNKDLILNKTFSLVFAKEGMYLAQLYNWGCSFHKINILKSLIYNIASYYNDTY